MDPKFVGPTDAQLKLLAASTQVASTNGAGLAIAGSAFAPANGGVPMQAVIPITSVKRSAGDETYAFKIQDSPDGATWTDRSPTTTASLEGLTVDGAGGLIVIGFFCRAYLVRLVTTLGGTAPSLVMGDSYIEPKVNAIG